jgi:hypothetical protein
MAKAPKEGSAKKNRGNQVKRINIIRKNEAIIKKLS